MEESCVLSSLRKIVSDGDNAGIPLHEILATLDEERKPTKATSITRLRNSVSCTPLIIPCLIFGLLLHVPVLQIWNGSFCALPTPAMMIGMIQPVADCNVCEGVAEAPRLVNLSRKDFALQHAHSSKPIVVVGAALNWSAMEVLSYEYFQSLYQRYPDAVDGDMSKGQFFSYSSNIRHLEDLFELSSERAAMISERWYIGWSTSDPRIAKEIKSLISIPYFISPMNSESDLTWIFMGAPGPGASMHIDSVGEPSWQAQISGTKTWTLVPPTECESVCASFNVTVNRGDIIVVDTNQWYHQTYIHPGNISITIGAEFR
jgi:histone arginine demethylase JMJD6